MKCFQKDIRVFFFLNLKMYTTQLLNLEYRIANHYILIIAVNPIS